MTFMQNLLDGEKMSKSKNNILDVFASEKKLKKQVHSIKTNSTPIEEPKDWKNCNLFNIYKLLASKEEIEKMKTNYKTGGYGFGHAKKELMDLILRDFSKERGKFNYFISNPHEVEQILQNGAKKAKVTADAVMDRVRKKLGY